MSWAIPLQLVSWVLVAFAGYRVGYVSCKKRTLKTLNDFGKYLSEHTLEETTEIIVKLVTAVRMMIDCLI